MILDAAADHLQSPAGHGDRLPDRVRPIASGQAHELPHTLPRVPRWVAADRGYTPHRFREHIWAIGSRPAIPPRRDEALVVCLEWIYNNRNIVERVWARLKEWRAVASCFEKTAESFAGLLHLAAAIDWTER